MKIKSISWRNFNSYGNKLSEIHFEKDQGNLFLILGQNGHGKTTISEVIKFGLYGKLDSKNLKDIPNRFNNNCQVRIVISKSENLEFVIERGIAPSYLRLFVNGVEYDQAGKKNIQDYINSDILEMPFYIFTNMISLSVNDFKSFLSMKPSDKRAIIDKLFGLEAINVARELVKTKISKAKDKISITENEIRTLESLILKTDSEIQQITKKILESNSEQKIFYESEIETLNKNLSEIRSKELKLSEKISELQSENKSIFSKNQELVYLNKKRQEKIELYSKDKCPTCESDFKTEFFLEKIQELQSDMADTESVISENKTIQEQIHEKLDKYEKLQKTISVKKGSILANIKEISNKLKEISDSSTISFQVESLENILTDSKTKKTTALNNLGTYENILNFYKIIDDIFSDKGIKKIAISKIIPLLNTEISTMISELGLQYRVTFNSDFEPSIMFLGYEVSHQQLSTGERKKLDFAILMALIKLMKLKYFNSNIIFLDEIFSSIDSDGIFSIISVLRKVSKDLKLNIFVINHSPLPVELFDYCLEITKNNNFSHINIEKL